jgi:hypothetical protein
LKKHIKKSFRKKFALWEIFWEIKLALKKLSRDTLKHITSEIGWFFHVRIENFDKKSVFSQEKITSFQPVGSPYTILSF